MANIKSAKKRIELNLRNKIQNRIYKSLIKNSTKKYFSLIEEYKENPNKELLELVEDVILDKRDDATERLLDYSERNKSVKKEKVTSFFTGFG